ncbi:hypothetical protein JCM17846_28920 [Iodidimonas nitroreducens]|uniref:Uncharacterized protein n=1 Tax=Iodidimonas nitroreducens TaxID=1236968 RepID=A0A5A7NCK9_9PROT|nr:hypothetical protein [Iodidimonas nitroreducens]GAK34608.1 hypothetical protein AQ1_02507 [alpha proteobacterium Q-1]GER05210.1 hypothetical protein JCM17846_28920 [Iodidimonas nitroreducens]
MMSPRQSRNATLLRAIERLAMLPDTVELRDALAAMLERPEKVQS